jgi:O-phospho-L-seryl-tRNASec:L-selenocysteinyl-tRNA synthase
MMCFRYPGRASSAPLMDLFITLLSMGRSGLLSLVEQRQQLFVRAKSELAALASKHGERLLQTTNQISMAMSLTRLGPDQATELGSKLFSRCCSGSRTVSCRSNQTVAGIAFSGFGAHIDAYPTPYLTVPLKCFDSSTIATQFSPALQIACAIGTTENDISSFMSRLDKTLGEMFKKLAVPLDVSGP